MDPTTLPDGILQPTTTPDAPCGSSAISDEFILDASSFAKAVPREEDGHRFVYCEASNDQTDLQGESIFQKALHDAAPYFIAKGNIDLDHMTVLGHRLGVENPYRFEIGRPVEVRPAPDATLVKGEIYRGHDMAEWFWKSLTEWKPAKQWYPSVAGTVLEREQVLDPGTRAVKSVIKSVRWNNLAFSTEPVNHRVPAVSVVPLAAFAKSFAGAGVTGSSSGLCQWEPLSDELRKTLTAGYGTDHATLTGGAALRRESVSPRLADVTVGAVRDVVGAAKTRGYSYHEHAARYLAELTGRKMKCGHGDRVSMATLSGHFANCYELPEDVAKDFARRLVADIGWRAGAGKK